MPTYRLDLAYDGSGFHGYARQAGLRTVQGELERALSRIIGPVDTTVAGRTDSGVHAAGQVVSLVTEGEIDTERVGGSLNGMLGPEIVVWGVSPVPDGFDARRSALRRTYRYLILNRPLPDPFLRHTSWHVPHPLSLDDMDGAARLFVGRQDFASFCRAAEGRSTIREVHDAGWQGAGDDLLRFEIVGASFCHQMVRSMVAVAVEVGRGRLAIGEVAPIIEARDRRAGRGAAPPHGLTLWRVDYPEFSGEGVTADRATS